MDLGPIVLLEAAGYLLVLLVWLIAVIGLLLGLRKHGAWRGRRLKMVIALAVSTLILAGTFLAGAGDSEGDENKRLIKAAVAKVRSEFSDPKGVQVEEVWLGDQRTFMTAVCGMVDSDEITNTSRFIFTTNLTEPPLETTDSGQEMRRGDLLRLQFPPKIEGFKPTDTGYWDKVGEDAYDFSEDWTRLCGKTEPDNESRGQ